MTLVIFRLRENLPTFQAIIISVTDNGRFKLYIISVILRTLCIVFVIAFFALFLKTGLYFFRLIRGDGEIVEEIVSRDRHVAINKVRFQVFLDFHCENEISQFQNTGTFELLCQCWGPPGTNVSLGYKK